jgi:hypothetical protein
MLGCDVMVFDDSKITNEITVDVTSIPIENNFNFHVTSNYKRDLKSLNGKITSSLQNNIRSFQ